MKTLILMVLLASGIPNPTPKQGVIAHCTAEFDGSRMLKVPKFHNYMPGTMIEIVPEDDDNDDYVPAMRIVNCQPVEVKGP